jgi:hypothetical protein
MSTGSPPWATSGENVVLLMEMQLDGQKTWVSSGFLESQASQPNLLGDG